MTPTQWIAAMLPVLMAKTVDKIEVNLETADVKAYWAGTIIRIDIQPKAAQK